MNRLRVVSVREPDNPTANVEFDTYIPFRFRTTQKPVGASFVRLGDLKRTLLELGVDPVNQMLTGVTLTAIAEVREAVAPVIAAVRTGLPVLGTAFSSGSQVVNLARDFGVAIGPMGLLIRWGDASSAPLLALEWGRVRFLVADGQLVGLWCSPLSAAEMATFDAAIRC